MITTRSTKRSVSEMFAEIENGRFSLEKRRPIPLFKSESKGTTRTPVARKATIWKDNTIASRIKRGVQVQENKKPVDLTRLEKAKITLFKKKATTNAVATATITAKDAVTTATNAMNFKNSGITDKKAFQRALADVARTGKSKWLFMNRKHISVVQAKLIRKAQKEFSRSQNEKIRSSLEDSIVHDVQALIKASTVFLCPSQSVVTLLPPAQQKQQQQQQKEYVLVAFQGNGYMLHVESGTHISGGIGIVQKTDTPDLVSSSGYLFSPTGQIFYPPSFSTSFEIPKIDAGEIVPISTEFISHLSSSASFSFSSNNNNNNNNENKNNNRAPLKKKVQKVQKMPNILFPSPHIKREDVYSKVTERRDKEENGYIVKDHINRLNALLVQRLFTQQQQKTGEQKGEKKNVAVFCLDASDGRSTKAFVDHGVPPECVYVANPTLSFLPLGAMERGPMTYLCDAQEFFGLSPGPNTLVPEKFDCIYFDSCEQACNTTSDDFGVEAEKAREKRRFIDSMVSRLKDHSVFSITVMKRAYNGAQDSVADFHKVLQEIFLKNKFSALLVEQAGKMCTTWVYELVRVPQLPNPLSFVRSSIDF